jgi:ankyrin repeat protein
MDNIEYQLINLPYDQVLRQSNKNGLMYFFHVCEEGKIDMVKLFLEKGANINKKDERGNTSMHVACRIGNIELVKLLLSWKEVNINEKNDWKNTPLHKACKNNHTEIVELLLRSGVNIDEENGYKYTPRIIASHNGNIEIIKLLLNYGAYDKNVFPNNFEITHITKYNIRLIIQLLDEYNEKRLNIKPVKRE